MKWWFTKVLFVATLVLITSSTFPGFAESTDEFPWDSFDEIIDFTANSHLNVKRVNDSVAYAAAAESAAASLPHPLQLIPRSVMNALKDKGKLSSEKIIEIDPKKPYVLLDLESLPLSYLISYDERFSLWEGTAMGRKDLREVIDWIDKNQKEYFQRKVIHPKLARKEPFSMHHVHMAAMNGYLSSFDPYTRLMDQAEWRRQREPESESRASIGVSLQQTGRTITIHYSTPGGPAARAGITSGDILTEVDDIPTNGLELIEVVQLLGGAPDSSVKLGLLRNQEALTINVLRAPLSLEAVEGTLTGSENFGTIKIRTFNYGSSQPAKVVELEIEKLKVESKGKLAGLILDLRGNAGGPVDAGVGVAELFLKKGVLISTIEKKTGREEIRNTREPILAMETPIVVMIDAGSYGASEILASSLQDNSRALIVGEQSFGGSTVQGLFIRGDFVVKVTTARFITPRGNVIQVRGISPDIQISGEPDNSFPLRFREVDLWRHFPPKRESFPLTSEHVAWVSKLTNLNVTPIKTNELRIKNLKRKDTDFLFERLKPYLRSLKNHPTP